MNETNTNDDAKIGDNLEAEADAAAEMEEENTKPIIQPIAPSAIHRLVAGQAVTDLSSAVKELIDNSIDAGASRIIVKLYNQGLESIEVSDNGSGVPSSSRPYMAMKHATSKLRNFDDLYNDGTNNKNSSNAGNAEDDMIACAPTLGFRGEALFCLANLSRSLVVSTRCNNTTNDSGVNNSLGEQFAFNNQGNQIPNSIKSIPRQVGTTVTVNGLFESLPVRRVDLQKRIKWQMGKLIKMMQGYAILCLNTQFNIQDIPVTSKGTKNKSSKKKKSEVRIATSESSNTLESRIASILSTKFLHGLHRIEVDLSSAVVDNGSNIQSTSEAGEEAPGAEAMDEEGNVKKHLPWKMTGLISHAPTSKSHPPTARELQFFSINGRPVDLPSVSRVLGDVWRMFDPTSAEAGGDGKIGGGGTASSSTNRRRPACILQFTLPPSMYDVNLSPDKREVLFTQESAMCDLIREGIMTSWSRQCDGNFVCNEVEMKMTSSSRKNAHDDAEVKSDGTFSKTSSKVVDENDEDIVATGTAASNDKIADIGASEMDINNTNDDDIDTVTPKMRRRSTNTDADNAAVEMSSVKDNNQPLVSVTPKVRRGHQVIDSNHNDIAAESSFGEPSPRIDDDSGGHINNPNQGSQNPANIGINKADISASQESATQQQILQQTGDETAMTTQQREQKQTRNGKGWDQQSMQGRARPNYQTNQVQQQQVNNNTTNNSDRRKWEQMRLNFQRIEKTELRNDMNRVMTNVAPSNEEDEVEPTMARNEEHSSEKMAPAQEESEQSTAKAQSHSSNSNSRSSQLQSKRQKRESRGTKKKQDVASFLESFAYGATATTSSTKPHDGAQSSDSSSDGDQSQSGEEEEERALSAQHYTTRRSNRENANNAKLRDKRHVRMVVGSTVVSSERKRSHGSSSGHSSSGRAPNCDAEANGSLDEDSDTSNDDADLEPCRRKSTKSSPIAQPAAEEQADEEDGQEVVWSSFSGTKNVIAQAQHARLMMRRNRKLVRSSLKRKRGDNDDDTGSNQHGQDSTISENDSNNKKGSTSKNHEKETVNLTKSDFMKMKIIGQFNLGFILVKCPDNHLWILDQHACDEKYNFERLCKETVLHEQPLIKPLPMELSPSEEYTILENMEVFERNGFRFNYNPDSTEPRFRLSLTALPHSGSGGDGKKAVQFGKEDVGALAAMLGADGTSSSEGYSAGFGGVGGGTGGGSDSMAGKGGRIAGVNAVRRFAGLDNSIVGSSIIRLPKAIAMFASRACRGSIMIGTALSHKEQVNILKKLDKTDIPWNCAHGRPTMSHIRSLAQCFIEDDDAVVAHVAGPSLSVISEDC